VTSGRKSAAEMARLYRVSEPTISRILSVERAQTSGRTQGVQAEKMIEV
jgi:Mor family transcriptional regulator